MQIFVSCCKIYSFVVMILIVMKYIYRYKRFQLETLSEHKLHVVEFRPCSIGLLIDGMSSDRKLEDHRK